MSNEIKQLTDAFDHAKKLMEEFKPKMCCMPFGGHVGEHHFDIRNNPFWQDKFADMRQPSPEPVATNGQTTPMSNLVFNPIPIDVVKATVCSLVRRFENVNDPTNYCANKSIDVNISNSYEAMIAIKKYLHEVLNHNHITEIIEVLNMDCEYHRDGKVGYGIRTKDGTIHICEVMVNEK